MTSLKRVVIGAVFCCELLLSFVAHATDKYGQNVDSELESAVVRARQMRLPYLVEIYDPKKSVEILTGVVSKKPDYFRAHFNLGLAYHELGDYEKSKAALDRAIEIRRKQKLVDNSIINTAGWVSLKHGDFKRAEELLKQAEALTTGRNSFTEGAVISNLGELYFLTQRFDQSREYFELSMNKHDNQSAQFYLELIEQIEKREKR